MQAFDEAKFNFKKVLQKEVLFQFQPNQERGEPSLDLSADVAPNANLVLINVSPIEYGHVLLVPQALAGLPQVGLGSTLLCMNTDSHTFHLAYQSWPNVQGSDDVPGPHSTTARILVNRLVVACAVGPCSALCGSATSLFPFPGGAVPMDVASLVHGELGFPYPSGTGASKLLCADADTGQCILAAGTAAGPPG